ncbi:unnamed protein product [Gongylonema pulchrum]|uniref:Uncharacterized protein n=1 Tax=Gongylonema pulchrum TaxID=637853 RepID=A0A183EV57_9BILA|nr:unnamed protein product [Gongylonema pulchrum]
MQNGRRSLGSGLTVSGRNPLCSTTAHVLRRRSEPLHVTRAAQYSTPPPPYTPSAPVSQVISCAFQDKAISLE